ncbi:MAG: hypothetical protein WDO17_09310 [Alphaproteobacteria bacterium]
MKNAPFTVRADAALFRIERAGRQVHEARRAVGAHAHHTRDRAVIENAAGAGRTLEAGEREQFAGDEAARDSAFIGSASAGATANRPANAAAARKTMNSLPVYHPGAGILPGDCRQILNAFTRS